MCECFKLCTDKDIINFTQYLPIVNTTNSYWYEYLKVVYGSYPQLPYDIQTLETFYPGLLPTRIDSCTGYKEFAWENKNKTETSIVQCNPGTCNKWLSETKRPFPGRPTIIKSIATTSSNLNHLLKHNSMSVFLVVQRANRSEALSNKWLEVVRVGSWSGEDKQYGCWFWKAAGSGVFIDTGNALTIRHVSRVRQHGFQASDRTWSRVLMSRNLTSLHILYTHPHLHNGIHQWVTTPYEIITVHHACMNRMDTKMACVQNLQLRTGWHAQEKCNCNHNHAHKQFSEDTLLCADQIQRAKDSMRTSMRYGTI